MSIETSYITTIYAIGGLASLMLIQLLIADLVGIRSKHIPGSTIPSDHSNFLFRASRVVANTNETIAIYILAIIFCVFSNVSPQTTAVISWVFVIARLCYAICYYCNLKILRSIIFSVSLLALLSLLVVGFAAYF